MHGIEIHVSDTLIAAREVQRATLLGRLRRDLKKFIRIAREAGIVHACKAGMLALRSRLMRRSERHWERSLGVSFTENVELDDLDIESKNKPLGFSYVPSFGHSFRAMVDSIPSDLDQFSFVDFGSGEGRALLMAAKYPFREIVGIEFAQELHDAAVRNIQKATSRQEPPDARIKSLHMDATLFDLPKQDCVLHFNNPFGEQVFSQVLNRIERLHSNCGTKVYILYQQLRNDLEPENARSTNVTLLRAAPFLKERRVRFPTIWTQFLLGSHELYLFDTRDSCRPSK